jgi:hypothetical protein
MNNDALTPRAFPVIAVVPKVFGVPSAVGVAPAYITEATGSENVDVAGAVPVAVSTETLVPSATAVKIGAVFTDAEPVTADTP